MQKTASSSVSESSSKVISNDKPAESSNKSGHMQTTKLISTDGIKTESDSSNVKSENAAGKEKTLSKLHTISKITENTTVSTTISTPASTTATTTTTVSHPRPIQPRPMEMKTNYEALVKSYGLNGVGNKVCNCILVFYFLIIMTSQRLFGLLSSFSFLIKKFKFIIIYFQLLASKNK